MSRRQLLVLVTVVPLVVVGGLLAGGAITRDADPAGLEITDASGAEIFEHDYLIPSGTAEHLASGEAVDIVPAELTVAVGEAIRIVNDDVEDHVVGVFFVAAGETLTQRFNSPGVLEGTCSVHSSGEFVLRVEA